MRKPNPWFVPPSSPLFVEHSAKASRGRSRSIDQDDEFDLELMETEARLLRAEISKICEGNRVDVVYVAASMLLADVLGQYPRKIRKRMIDETVNYLLRIIDRK
jgi:hypothetical protein